MMSTGAAITRFRGENEFLSNFYTAQISIFGYTFNNVEEAFQSQKNPNRAHEFVGIGAAAAKRKGREVKLRADWDSIKDTVMYQCLLAKFQQNPELRVKLLETGNAELIEGNTWGDTYWGMVNGVGQNRLGMLLMLVRNVLN